MATEAQIGEADSLPVEVRAVHNKLRFVERGLRNGGMRCVLGVMILMKVVVMDR